MKDADAVAKSGPDELDEPILWQWRQLVGDWNFASLSLERPLLWPMAATALLFLGLAMGVNILGYGRSQLGGLLSAGLVCLGGIFAVAAIARLLNVSSDRLGQAIRRKPSYREIIRQIPAPHLYRGFTMTPTRLIRRNWDGTFNVTDLSAGNAVIQYGKLRIDTDTRRGDWLIEALPKDEQKRLFAAIKQARALREGRTETPA